MVILHRTGPAVAALALVATSFVSVSFLSAGTATGMSLGAAAGHAVPTCDGKPATVVGASGDDHLRGGPGNDVIVGLGGNDTVNGRGGNDLLCGGAGNDHLIGGKGDDTMIGQQGRDDLDDEGGGISVMKGGPGHDFLTTEASPGGQFDGGPGNDEYFIVADHAHLDGGPGNDELELLSPFWADESIAGGSGHDELLFDLDRHSTRGPGYRVVSANLAAGTMRANRTSVPMTGIEDLVLSDEDLSVRSELPAIAHRYILRGTAGPNELYAGVAGHHAPPVEIFGRGGDDTMHGGSGSDLIDGGPGHDTGNAGNGHDVCRSVEVAKNCEVVRP